MHHLTLSLGCLLLSSACLAQTWTQVQTPAAPSARWQQVMSYDFVSGRTILFGGRPTGNTYLNDTWEYNGATWTQVKTTTSPPARWLSEMVYNRGRLRSLMFGGLASGTYLADTWVYDSIKKTWTQMQPKTTPPGRYNAALAYDSARNRIVMFGGQTRSGRVADTWEWDGNDWKQMQPTNSPSARYTAMAYDAARKVVVLYGGSNNAGDTWEYDGNNWKQINTSRRPSAYCCVAMAYDVVRQRIVVFGGFTPNKDETWEYDGNDWTQIQTTTKPSARRDFDNMVYDSRRGRMVLFGGYTNSQHNAETWEYAGAQSLIGTPATISIATGGTHAFGLDAGTKHANRLYWIFGSVTGTSPGVTLASPAGSVRIPLNPDFWTDVTIGLANTPVLSKTRGILDASGKASAAFNVHKTTVTSAIGVKFYHAYLVYDGQGNFYMASNPVVLTLVK